MHSNGLCNHNLPSVVFRKNQSVNHSIGDWRKPNSWPSADCRCINHPKLCRQIRTDRTDRTHHNYRW